MTNFIRPGSASDLTKRLETLAREDADGLLHALKVHQTELQTALDKVSADELYVGKAEPEAGAGDAAWQIKKLVKVGGLLTVKFANGSKAFQFSWNARASYTY